MALLSVMVWAAWSQQHGGSNRLSWATENHPARVLLGNRITGEGTRF